MRDRVLGSESGILDDRDLRLLLLAGITSPLAVSLVSPVFDTLIGPFGASPTSIGLMVTAYTGASLAAVPLSGVVADRVGRKPVLIAGLLLFGAAGAAISLAPDYRTVLALRALQGIGSAGITPIVIAGIGDRYTAAEAAAAQGLRIAAVGGAQTVFPLLAAVLVIVAWQLPFLIYAMAIPIALVVFRYLEEPATDDAPATDPDGGDDRSYLRDLVRLLRRPHVPAVLVAYGGPSFLYFGFQAYVSVAVVRVIGGSPQGAGLLVALFSVIYATAATQSGRIAARFGGRLPPLVATNVVMAVGLSVFAFAPAFPVAVAGGAVFGVGFGVTTSLYRSVLPEYAPEGLRGGLVSTGETLARLAATVAPIVLAGLLAAFEPATGFGLALRWALAAAGAGIGLLGVAAVSVASYARERNGTLDA